MNSQNSKKKNDSSKCGKKPNSNRKRIDPLVDLAVQHSVVQRMLDSHKINLMFDRGPYNEKEELTPFVEFASRFAFVNSNGSPLPAEERALILLDTRYTLYCNKASSDYEDFPPLTSAQFVDIIMKDRLTASIAGLESEVNAIVECGMNAIERRKMRAKKGTGICAADKKVGFTRNTSDPDFTEE
jgi:hypothetical protein